MNPKTMRSIDWYVGVPLCYVLAFFVWLLKPRVRALPTVKNILFIKFFGLGSIILSEPAIRAAREQFPGATIHYLTFLQNREILEFLGTVDHIHTIETKSLIRFIRSTLSTVAALRREHIDLVFDLEFFAKFSLIVSVLVNAKRVAGFYLTYEPWRRILLDYHGSYNHYAHVKDIFLSIVYLVKEQDPFYLKFTQWCKRYTLEPLPPKELALLCVREKLVAQGWNASMPLIILNPNAGKELAPQLKRWIDERWIELTGKLLRKYPNALILYTGVSSEAKYVEQIVSRISSENKVCNGAGQFSLEELHALFSLTSLFITIDSGPMHVASLTSAPIVGLFFAESPILYAPLSSSARVIAPELYSLPSFTVYTGKDPMIPLEDTLARAAEVTEVFDAAQAVFRGSGNKV